jgi:hypothetical protein
MYKRTYFLIALLLAGCAAEGDGEAGQSGTDVLRDPCGAPQSERPLGADEVVGRTTAAQLVALAQGTYTFRESWTSWPADTDQLTSREVSGEFVVTADVTRASEQTWYADPQGDSCPRTIVIPSVITLRTDDGTLAGEFTGTLRARWTNSGLPAFAVHGLRRRAELTGSFDASGYADDFGIVIALQGDRAGTAQIKLTQASIVAVDTTSPSGTSTMTVALWN